MHRKVAKEQRKSPIRTQETKNRQDFSHRKNLWKNTGLLNTQARFKIPRHEKRATLINGQHKRGLNDVGKANTFTIMMKDLNPKV
jgi:N-acetylneuraminic acid mutarotase